MAGKISVIMAPQVLGSPKRHVDGGTVGKVVFRVLSKPKVEDRGEAVEIENVPCSRGCHI